jgi:alpha-mannosidase
MTLTRQAAPLSVYYHTHWDREWYLPFRSYQVRLAEVVDEVLERLENNILPCFMLDGQTVVLDDYLELRPENRERLKRLIANGRLSIGPWFVMPDEFLVGGESLIRNLMHGVQESRAWGCHRFTGYLPDTFGHSADIPTILKNVGLNSTVVWRGVNPAKSVFQWQSPSGASVKALHLTDGYFQMMLHDWEATEPQQLTALSGLVDKLEQASPSQGIALLPIGGDHLAPLSEVGHQLLNKKYSAVHETTPDAFLAGLNLNGSLETISGELIDNKGSFLLPGVYSSRMYLKQANRRLEHRLVHVLEPLLAMAQVWLPKGTFRYPTHELALAWKTLMLNHPHDSICGCSVDAVHRENEVRFDQVQQLSDALLERVAYLLATHVASSEDWIVLNTGDCPYAGVVPVIEDVPDKTSPTQLTQVETETVVLQDEYLHDPHRIPLSHLTKLRRTGWLWVQNVPAYGCLVIPKDAKNVLPDEERVRTSSVQLDNRWLTVSVNPDGTLTVTDKNTGRTYANLLRFQDQAEQGDSYNSAPVPGTASVTAEFQGSRVIYSGPLVGVLELTHAFPRLNMMLYTEVRLEAGSQVLTFQTRFTNHQADHKLQVLFPTGQPITEVLAESHLGIVKRTYDPNYREQDHMPVEKMKELKTNTGPIQRFISANGQSWITEGLTEYEVYQDTLRLTLLRSFGALSSGDTGVLGAQAGPPFETPEGQCLNRDFCCRYAWLPTPAELQGLYAQAARFYGTVWAKTGCGEMHAKQMASLITWDQPTLVASSCYWAPQKGLILRLLNPTDKPVSTTLQLGFATQSIQFVNFLEEPVSTLTAHQVTLGPHDVQTLLFTV